MSDSSRLRIAFIGAGQMAGHHLDALSRVRTPHTVVGVQDVRLPMAQAFARRAPAEARAFGTIADLLAQTQPDLVHICTPAGTHVEPARQALMAGAHVYVEKPFVETPQEAETLFAAARMHGRLICSGHQLLRDPAFQQLMQEAPALEPVTLIDSWFSFRPPRLDPYQAPDLGLSRQLLDVVPHPLYVLVAALERFGDGAIEIQHVTATPTALYALLRRGEVTGRLAVTLRARPIASTLTIAGANGSLTADFVRSMLVGAGNEGTSPVEKILNPFLEAAQLGWRNATSLIRRITKGVAYPGLADLLGDFYAAVAAHDESPVSIDHLRSVTAVYEHLAASVRGAVKASPLPITLPRVASTGNGFHPVAVVTGAGGFFGRAISRELVRRGSRVRGIGRSERPDDVPVDEWVRADLAGDIPPHALAGAQVVVHAAAETAGGFEAHERNSVGATRELLRAMTAAGVRRLVHISSISVLRPPRPFWERQGEQTPLAERPEQLGPYTWGKCGSEQLVAAAQASGEIDARIVRPAALIDFNHLEMPGLLGRRLFGDWHLGLGRPGLPFAICDVSTAAAVVAWCAERFIEAPPTINLFEPDIGTRAQLLDRFRRHGWRGRMVWTPISLLAGAAMSARFMMGVLKGERPQPMAIWSILRPRRYDGAVASRVLAAVREKDHSVGPQPRLWRAASSTVGA